MPPGAVKVDRTTLFGSPFPIKEYGRRERLPPALR
jgi:hypothetical protein